MSKIVDDIYGRMSAMLDKMAQNPDSVTEADKTNLNALYSKLCKAMGISEHSQWAVQWRVQKWFDAARHKAGFEPDEIALSSQNIIVTTGATEMLKLITGTGGTAYSQGNAYIYVGNDTTAETANDTGVKAKDKGTARGVDYDYAEVTSVVVSGRQATFQATFDASKANFAWNEVCITNGTGVGNVAMNRKVDSLGTKSGGIWTLQVIISLTSV